MKKILMTICLVFFSLTMFAEQGETWVGLTGNAGLNSNYKNYGPSLKLQYELFNNVRVEASASYFFKTSYAPSSDITIWDANLNLHYVFRIGDLGLYPLVGGSLVNKKYDDVVLSLNESQTSQWGLFENRQNENKMALNAGAGLEYKITSKLKVNGEFKMQIMQNNNRPVVSVGVAYAL